MRVFLAVDVATGRVVGVVVSVAGVSVAGVSVAGVATGCFVGVGVGVVG